MTIEKEPVATTPIGKYFDTTTSYVGTYIIDRIKSTASIIVSELHTLMDNCQVLTKKESFMLSQRDDEHVEESINKLQKAVKLFGDGINDWKFTNDMRALQLSLDDLTIMVLACADNTRHVAQEYNWRKFSFILNEIGIGKQIINTIDDARRKYILKTGRRKGEHGDPFGLTRKWYKRLLLGYRFICPNCKHETRDSDLLEYIEPDKSSRHNE